LTLKSADKNRKEKSESKLVKSICVTGRF